MSSVDGVSDGGIMELSQISKTAPANGSPSSPTFFTVKEDGSLSTALSPVNYHWDLS